MIDFQAAVAAATSRQGDRAMMRRYNRLLVAFYVISDAAARRGVAFVLAYLLRFEASPASPVPKGIPPFERVPDASRRSSALLVPIAFHIQGLYRLRRGRSRVDDFFAVFVGTILAVVLGLGGTLYYQTYYLRTRSQGRRASTKSRRASGACSFSSTSVLPMRRANSCARRWSAAGRPGIGLKRVLIAGAGDLGRMVADKVLEHRELGFKVVGFLDDRAGRSHRLPRPAAARHAQRRRRDHPARKHRPRLRRAAARRARQDARHRRGHQPRRRRRPRRPRPAAVHRAARAAREPRRRSNHQPQRRAAARLQQRPEAR